MPKSGLSQNFELQTRDRYTKVDCQFTLTVDGRELPNMSVLGSAMEKAIELVREMVLESYKTVPERDAFADTQQAATPAQPVAVPATPATPSNPFGN